MIEPMPASWTRRRSRLRNTRPNAASADVLPVSVMRSASVRPPRRPYVILWTAPSGVDCGSSHAAPGRSPDRTDPNRGAAVAPANHARQPGAAAHRVDVGDRRARQLDVLDPARALRVRAGRDRRARGRARRAHAPGRPGGPVRGDARRPPLAPVGAGLERGGPDRRAARRRVRRGGGRPARRRPGVRSRLHGRADRAPPGTGGADAPARADPRRARGRERPLEHVGFLGGSLAAGALASLFALDVGFAACAAALALTWLLAASLPRDERPAWIEDDDERGGLGELLAGARTVWAHGDLRLLVVVFGINSLAQGIIDVLVVVSALELLDLGTSGAGWSNAAWGVGGVAGGAAALVLLGRGRLAAGLSIGLGIAGVSFLLVGLWGQSAPAFALLAVMGVGFALVEAALLTLAQRLAADDVLARVFGVEESLEVVLLGVGSVIAAVLVAAFGIEGAVIATGAVLAL